MRQRKASSDEGFTLIEVIVAMGILVMVSIAFSMFAIQGLKLSTQQQRMQTAIAIATERTEQVQRFTASSTSIDRLVAGRTAAAVSAAWTALAGVPGVANTYPRFGAIAAPTEAVPLTKTETRDGNVYESTVLIGTCYQPHAGGACTLLPGVGADPGPAATAARNSSQLVRVIVTVAYAGDCVGGCSYSTAILYDTKADQTWQLE